jgi:hypothetical protein
VREGKTWLEDMMLDEYGGVGITTTLSWTEGSGLGGSVKENLSR